MTAVISQPRELNEHCTRYSGLLFVRAHLKKVNVQSKIF